MTFQIFVQDGAFEIDYDIQATSQKLAARKLVGQFKKSGKPNPDITRILRLHDDGRGASVVWEKTSPAVLRNWILMCEP